MGSIVDFCCGQKKEKQSMPRRVNQQRQFKEKGEPPSVKQSTINQQSISRSPNNLREDMIDDIIHEKAIQRDCKRVVFEDFEIKGKLGSGNFGAVFKVNYVNDLKQGKIIDYAMKRIAITKINNKRSEQNIKLERFILSQMQNPFITQLKFAFKDENYIFLVMECGNGGSLDSFLNIKKTTNPRKNMRAIKFKNLGEDGIKFVSANIILGIEHLHNHNIMYRDLKPQNVIIFDDGFAKLTDFGLSKILKEDDYAQSEAGTIVYFAPEIVQKKNYTKMIDFWTLGVFLYQLLTSETPFTETQILTRKRFREVVQEHQKSRDWKKQTVSEQLKDLINKLLVYQPQQRLGCNGFAEIKAHPYFKQIDWQQLKKKRIQSPLKKILEEHPNKMLQVKPYHFKSLNSKNYSTEENEWDFHHAYSLSYLKQQKQQ